MSFSNFLSKLFKLNKNVENNQTLNCESKQIDIKDITDKLVPILEKYSKYETIQADISDMVLPC